MNNKKILLSAIGVILGLGLPLSLKAADYAMIAPVNQEPIADIDTITLESNIKERIARDPQLVYRLGKLYETGTGVQRNDRIAFRLYEYAAVNGFADAQYSLGLMYADERCPVNVDDAQQLAMYWLELAARQGHRDARFSYEYQLNNTHYAGC